MLGYYQNTLMRMFMELEKVVRTYEGPTCPDKTKYMGHIRTRSTGNKGNILDLEYK